MTYLFKQMNDHDCICNRMINWDIMTGLTVYLLIIYFNHRFMTHKIILSELSNLALTNHYKCKLVRKINRPMCLIKNILI